MYSGPKIIYVGQSQRVGARLRIGHRLSLISNDLGSTPWGILDFIAIKIRLDKAYGERLMREARLIRRLNPSGNKERKAGKSLVRKGGMTAQEIYRVDDL